MKLESSGDWSTAARKVSSLNHPSTCQFGDIMGLVPENLKKKLETPLREKVILSKEHLKFLIDNLYLCK